MGKTHQEFFALRRPRLIPGLSRIDCGALPALVVLMMLFSLAGCGGPSPRFGSVTRSSTETTSTELSKASEEERKEDDAPVDASVKESIAEGARDFKREKNPALTSGDQARVMREISKYMGVPYSLGGDNGQGLDCSAYTRLVYRNALKKELPRTSREQFKSGSSVGFNNLMFGDLIFFNTTGQPASHVGIYLGDDLFAHASVTFGVTISSLTSSYYKKRYEGAKRVIE